MSSQSEEQFRIHRPLGQDQFRATKIWKQVVQDLYDRINDGPPAIDDAGSTSSSASGRRDQRKFSGAEAVETLTSYLTENRGIFGFKEDITEEKATKLCQVYLRDNIIAPVPENKHGKQFEASKNVFYYFANRPNTSSSSLSVDNFDKENLRRFVTPRSCRSVAVRTSMVSLSSVEDVGDLDEKILHDLALSRLLILVEIPILDGILHVRTEDGSGSVLKTLENLFGGIKLGRQRNDTSVDMSDEDRRTPNDDPSDRWVHAASQCLQLCQPSVEATATSTTRESLYRAVINSYKSMVSKRGSLIPSQYAKILDQISLLVKTGDQKDATKALEAAQCLCLLLPKETRDQIGSLLEYITVMREEAVRFRRNSKLTNIELNMTLGTFSRFIFPKEAQCDVVMDLFVKYAHCILACPKDFREHVYRRQKAILDSFTDPKPEVAFCDRITAEEYTRQALTATEQALYDALSNMVNDSRMSDSRKHDWFEKFRKEYPKIYEARFPSKP